MGDGILKHSTFLVQNGVWIWATEGLNDHSMIGTSLWVPAQLSRLGTRAKTQKAGRATGVRSQARRLRGRGVGCRLRLASYDADRASDGGDQVQTDGHAVELRQRIATT